MSDVPRDPLQAVTRRHFFEQAAFGLGGGGGMHGGMGGGWGGGHH